MKIDVCRTTRAEEIFLAGRIREGDRAAIDRLVEGNLPLLQNLAQSYSRPDYPLDDAMQEGMMGLRRAAERYDADQAARVAFGTYATPWIKQSIRRDWHAQVNLLAKIPAEIHKKTNEVEGGRTPLATFSAEDQHRIRDCLRGRRRESGEALPYIPEGGGAGPPVRLEQLRDVLRTLSAEHRRFVHLRWGLDCGPPTPLLQIARIMGMNLSDAETLDQFLLNELRAKIEQHPG